jgi:endonuclease/exonuclease/phosphatase (EEP) superfamily protein YafD
VSGVGHGAGGPGSGIRVPPSLHGLAWLCAIGAAWIILPAQAAPWTFLGALLVHWTAHAAMLLVAPLVIWRRRRVHCVALLVLMALALWPWWLAAWSPRSAPATGDGEGDLAVASFNLLVSNPAPAADIPAVRDCRADVLVLIEAGADDEASLRGDPRWPHQRWIPDGSIGGREVAIAVLSRHPLDAVILHDLEGNVAMEARLICAGRPLRLVALHPRAPISEAAWTLRDRQLSHLAELVRSMAGPVVVLGDLNLTVADPAWRRLLAETGLQRAGGADPATWPWLLGPGGIAIDHVLVGHGARVGAVHAVDLAGSDHRGIAAMVDVR